MINIQIVVSLIHHTQLMAAAAKCYLAILSLIETLSYKLFKLQLSYIPLLKERERSCVIEGSISLPAITLKAGQLRLLDHEISDNCSIVIRLDIHS